MKHLILIMAFLLTSCTTLKNTSANHELSQKIAPEAAIFLAQQYSPATTVFINKNTTSNQLDNAIEDSLRQQGFIVENSNITDEAINDFQQKNLTIKLLNYTFEQIEHSSNAYYISIEIDKNVYSRVFDYSNQTLTHIGSWSKKE